MKLLCLLILFFTANASLASNYGPDKSNLILYWLGGQDPVEGVSPGFQLMGEAFEIEILGCETWFIQGDALLCTKNGLDRKIAHVLAKVEEGGGDLGYPALYREMRLLPGVKVKFKPVMQGKYISQWQMIVQ
jgi:hypothetical protein